MNYNINFQVAAVIIIALLLYHFLTQKKLHNANVKTFTYILVLSGLYTLSDLLGTLTIMNYTAEDEGTVMGILTGIYLLDILIPYILYSCIPDSRENEKKSGALSVICAGITVAMMIAVLGNLGSGDFSVLTVMAFFKRNRVRVSLSLCPGLYRSDNAAYDQKQRGLYAGKDEYCRRISCDRRRMYRSGTVHRVHISVRFWTGTWSHISLSYDEQSR